MDVPMGGKPPWSAAVPNLVTIRCRSLRAYRIDSLVHFQVSMTPNASDDDDDDNLGLTKVQKESSPELKWVDGFTRTLDTRLTLPGTKIRFGLDFVLGLIPGVGDAISLALSGILIATMAKNGVSIMLVIKMLGNVLLDTIVGAIPILGNVFDLFYKANTRNLKLMREYYNEDRHHRGGWLAIGFVVLAILAIGGLLIWAVIAIAMLIYSMAVK